MARLTLRFEPLSTAGVQDAAESATWGSLFIEVRHRDGSSTVLTHVYDRRARGVRYSVDGTVLPLAEWLARNWFVLFHSARLPQRALASRRADYRWRRSHCLRYVGEGMALPDVRIHRSTAESWIVEWARDPGEPDSSEPVQFLAESGSVRVSRDELEADLSDFVDEMIRRCEQLAPDNMRTRDLRAAWTRVLDSNHPDFRVAVMAGRMDEALERLPSEARTWLSHAPVDEPVLSALFDLADVEDIESLIGAKDRIESVMSTASSLSNRLMDLRQRVERSRVGEDWERGWRDAKSFRSALGAPQDEPLAPQADLAEHHVEALGGVLGSRDAFVTWLPGRQPCVLSPRARSKFYQHRNVWPALFAGDVRQREAFAIAPGVSGHTSVAGAFAAELVAPVERIRRELDGRAVIAQIDVDELALDIDAPSDCVRHQIVNHRLSRILN